MANRERWLVVMRKSLNLLCLRSNIRQHHQMDITVRQTQPPQQQQVGKELQSLCESAIVVSSVSPSTQWVSVELARDATLGVACDFIRWLSYRNSANQPLLDSSAYPGPQTSVSILMDPVPRLYPVAVKVSEKKSRGR
jgi:hypothetical protein